MTTSNAQPKHTGPSQMIKWHKSCWRLQRRRWPRRWPRKSPVAHWKVLVWIIDNFVTVWAPTYRAQSRANSRISFRREVNYVCINNFHKPLHVEGQCSLDEYTHVNLSLNGVMILRKAWHVPFSHETKRYISHRGGVAVWISGDFVDHRFEGDAKKPWAFGNVW